MFECVTDKEALVQEIGRILKPGGTVLCVNCDWDSVVYNGRDKDLIARAVHAYAVTKQGWMEDPGQLDRQKNVWYFQSQRPI